MVTEEDIAQQQSLLQAHRQTLTVYVERYKLLGRAFVSPDVVHGIFFARQNIRSIKSVLRSWGIDVEPDLYDDDPVPSTNAQRKIPLADLLWPDGSILVLLPVRLDNGNALCISKHPVTNHQYKKFVDATHAPTPRGEHYRGGKWIGPFVPWEAPSFSGDNQPVVCVSYDDADTYCKWVNTLIGQHNRAIITKQPDAPNYPYPKSSTRIPSVVEWDYAACGDINTMLLPPDWWHRRQQEAIFNVNAPESIDLVGTRTNSFGIADMIGNVWEWCFGDNLLPAALGPDDSEPEVRGGAFLDDVLKYRSFPKFKSSELLNGRDTRHSDLGFRVAVEIDARDLTEEDQVRVASFPPLYPW